MAEACCDHGRLGHFARSLSVHALMWSSVALLALAQPLTGGRLSLHRRLSVDVIVKAGSGERIVVRSTRSLAPGSWSLQWECKDMSEYTEEWESWERPILLVTLVEQHIVSCWLAELADS